MELDLQITRKHPVYYPNNILNLSTFNGAMAILHFSKKQQFLTQFKKQKNSCFTSPHNLDITTF